MTTMARSQLNAGDEIDPEGHADVVGSSTVDATHAPVWGRDQNSDSSSESPWARKIILCLDGGGVRGFASLLILQKIMNCVRDIEQNGSDDTTKRFESSAAYHWFDRHGEQRGRPPDTPWNDGDFLPHQYFDYFVGTSTGGLSALMLGRLRMDVQDALSKYDDVGNQVFARPRHITGGGFLHARFKARYLEKALQLITAEHRKHEFGPTQRSSAGQDGRVLSIPLEELSNGELRRKAKAVRLRNKNVDAARTVVVAHGGRAALEPLLYRSYDHREPNDISSDNNPREDEKYKDKHYKHFQASDLPLWKIARATSAAPGYFSPIVIDKEQVWDGALAGANNPVRLACDEVNQMHGPHQPALIVSIGTGVKTPRAESRTTAPATGLPAERNIRNLMSLRNVFRDAVLNSERLHNDFLGHVEEVNQRFAREEDKLDYYRFNVPEDSGLKEIKLGEWRGEKGEGTKESMRRAVDAYTDIPAVNRKIRACASKMVQIRHRRQATIRWERYALNIVYCCPEKACKGRIFESRLKFRNHAVRTHGRVWKVPSHDHRGTVSHEYTCIWDKCSESKVTVFDAEADLVAHLKGEHRMTDPRVLSPEDLEDWLDRGRKTKLPGVPRWQTRTGQ